MSITNPKLPKMGYVPFVFLICIFFLHLRLSNAHASKFLQQCTSPSAAPHQVRAGYWFSNSNHYSQVSNINSSLYTHLYYYSLSLDDAGTTVALPQPDQFPIFTTFSTTLKSNNPSLKTLLSIATNDHQSNASNAAFSAITADPALRAAFINSSIELARANAFDGLDLAWQFPSSSLDMANLGVLLAEWRARIDEETQNSSPPLLLTATVYFSNHLFDGPTNNLDYPTEAISNDLDWANALCFGYHRISKVTAADAPLFDKASHFSTSYGITAWLDAGIPACKLVMGVPLYGRSWFLKNKEKNELDAPVVAAGPRQKLSNQTGIMAYFEIKEHLMDPNSVAFYDNHTVSSYFHSGDLWVSFDSPKVVEEKIKFALRKGLLGYFLWPISFDDLNYTISKQASDVWLKDHDLENFVDDTGLEEASSPAESPPQDHALTPTTASSSFTRRFLTIYNFYLHCFPLLLVLFYLRTI